MKATLTNGAVLEGTAEEFRAVFGQDLPAKVSDGDGGVSLWNEAMVRELWESLGSQNQRKVVKHLLAHDGRGTYEDLKKLLGFAGSEGGIKLAAVLANITRNCRRISGYDKAKIVEWNRSDDQGNGYYYIPEGVLQLLRKVVS